MRESLLIGNVVEIAAPLGRRGDTGFEVVRSVES